MKYPLLALIPIPIVVAVAVLWAVGLFETSPGRHGTVLSFAGSLSAADAAPPSSVPVTKIAAWGSFGNKKADILRMPNGRCVLVITYGVDVGGVSSLLLPDCEGVE